MPELSDWSFAGVCLTGRVYGHKRFPDGSHIRTSKIKSVQGRWAQTVSGTIYRLRGPARNPGSLDTPSQDISIVQATPATERADENVPNPAVSPI